MDDLVQALRGMILRGVAHNVDDSGGIQVADIETAEGVVRAAVHVLQMPGLACNPGVDGIMAVVLAPGGDQGEPLVLLTATGAGMGGVPQGGAILYALDGGAMVKVLPGGELWVQAKAKVTVEAPEVAAVATTKASITAPEIDLVGTVKITGLLQVNGVTVLVP